MRWLVTGGAGFIGSHVVDALLERPDWEVVVLDNLTRGSLDNLAPHLASGRLHFFQGDIRDEATATAACAGADAVLHLAARSNVMGAETAVADSCETNVGGTVNVLNAALSAGCETFVFASSREVYGDPQSLPVDETAPLAPKNLYGASKVAGEHYCSVFRQRGLDVRVLRLSNVYGPRDHGRVIPLWLERAHQGLPLQIFGGRQVLDLIWVDVVVAAILRAALAPALASPVNIGSGQATPILLLAERVIELSGSPSTIDLLPAREQEVSGYVANVQAMRRLLHLQPPADPLGHLPLMLRQSAPAPA